jgi:hypothetical protein
MSEFGQANLDRPRLGVGDGCSATAPLRYAGLACAPVGHSAAINAQINCTGAQLAAGETGTVIVQGRGQVAGAGTLVGTLNNSRAVQESSYDNNVKQLTSRSISRAAAETHADT